MPPGWMPRRCLRERRHPLCSHESGFSLADFDLIWASPSSTSSPYTTILNMLDLAGIPLRSRRAATHGDPLVDRGWSRGLHPGAAGRLHRRCSCSATARRRSLELCDAVREWKRARAAGARSCLRRGQGDCRDVCPGPAPAGRGRPQADRIRLDGWTTARSPSRSWRSSTTGPTSR